jgi:serine/threonine protein kinase
MSPEIIQKIPHLYEVDCWSFVCILYELISGEKAFQSTCNTIKGLSRKILYDDPNPLIGWYSPEIFVLVEDLLVKNGDHRLSSSLCVQSPIFAQAFISLGIKFQQGNHCSQNISLTNFFLQLALNAANLKGQGWMHRSTSSTSNLLRQLKKQADIGSLEGVNKYAFGLLKGTDQYTLTSQEFYSVFRKEPSSQNPFLLNKYALNCQYDKTLSQDKAMLIILFKKAVKEDIQME